MDLFILRNIIKIIPLRVRHAVILTYGPSTGFCRFDASGMGLCGATVVGGAGVAIGNNVPSWREEIYYIVHECDIKFFFFMAEMG